MKSILNWRQCVLNVLFAGCFYALLMVCEESDTSFSVFISIRIAAVLLAFMFGYPLYRLTKKWEREGKIKTRYGNENL